MSKSVLEYQLPNHLQALRLYYASEVAKLGQYKRKNKYYRDHEKRVSDIHNQIELNEMLAKSLKIPVRSNNAGL
jgi:hypothetical protein